MSRSRLVTSTNSNLIATSYSLAPYDYTLMKSRHPVNEVVSLPKTFEIAQDVIVTGNPHTRLFANLQERGVRVELCRATAKAHHLGNIDLLPGIKVNTDAMARTIQLVQEGLVKITE